MARRRAFHTDEGAGYWPSFVDIMAVLVLVLLFVLVTSFIQAAVSIQQRVVGKAAVQKIMDRRKNLGLSLQEAIGKQNVELTPEFNLAFKGDMLFIADTAELKNDKDVDQLLQRLATSLGAVLANEEYRKGLQLILVEGHTADDGQDPSTHWKLSDERARRIVMTLQAKDARLRDPNNAKYLGAVGRAHYEPVVKGSTEAEMSPNRRVEIRIVLKDENLREALMDAFEK